MTPPPPSKLQARVAAAAAAALAVALYAGFLDNPFVYDDLVHIVDKEAIRDPGNLPGLLAQDRFRPLINLTYAFNYAAGGLDPFGYHLVNVGIHGLNVLLLFALVRRLGRDAARMAAGGADPPAPLLLPALAAGLLAAHPLMTEAVGYVSGRAEILCTTFFLAAFLALRRWLRDGQRRRRIHLVLGLLAAAFSVLSKEHGAMLPLLLLAYDRLLIPGDDGGAARARLLRFHLPLCGLLLLGGAARVGALLLWEYDSLPRPVLQNLLMQFSVIWRYILLLLLPLDQAVVHQVRAVSGALDPIALGAGAALFALGALAYLVRRSLPLLALGTLWFLLLLAPSSSLVPLLEPMAEHRVYLAAGGFFLALAALLLRGLSLLSLPRAGVIPLGGILFGGLLAALSWATVARLQVWADPVALWSEAVKNAPRVWAPHYALGDALRARGRCDEAVAHYRAAMEILPEEARAYINLGICLAQRGEGAEARRVFENVLRFEPGNLRALNNLGTLALRAGELAEARRRFGEVLKQNPQNITALASLALAAAREEDYEQAYRRFEQVLGLDPDNVFALQHMVVINAGPFKNPSEALRLALELQRLAPNTPGLAATVQRLRAQVGPR